MNAILSDIRECEGVETDRVFLDGDFIQSHERQLKDLGFRGRFDDAAVGNYVPLTLPTGWRCVRKKRYVFHYIVEDTHGDRRIISKLTDGGGLYGTCDTDWRDDLRDSDRQTRAWREKRSQKLKEKHSATAATASQTPSPPKEDGAAEVANRMERCLLEQEQKMDTDRDD